MFRHTKNRFHLKNFQQNKKLNKLLRVFFPKTNIKVVKKNTKSFFIKKRIRKLSGIFIYNKLFPSLDYPWNVYRSGSYYTQRDSSFEGKKYFYETIQKYSINTKLFSLKLSDYLKRTVCVKFLNLFTYLIKKGRMNYKTMQVHLWKRRLRKFRFHFANYWDLMNSFFLLKNFNDAHHVLLQLLITIVPHYKGQIKKLFLFLDLVIKTLLQRSIFNCFKITLTGKIRGGTQRTTQLTVGFGRLVINSVSENIINDFIATKNIAGAFGVKLVMSKKVRNPFSNLKEKRKIIFNSFKQSVRLIWKNPAFISLVDSVQKTFPFVDFKKNIESKKNSNLILNTDVGFLLNKITQRPTTLLQSVLARKKIDLLENPKRYYSQIPDTPTDPKVTIKVYTPKRDNNNIFIRALHLVVRTTLWLIEINRYYAYTALVLFLAYLSIKFESNIWMLMDYFTNFENAGEDYFRSCGWATSTPCIEDLTLIKDWIMDKVKTITDFVGYCLFGESITAKASREAIKRMDEEERKGMTEKEKKAYDKKCKKNSAEFRRDKAAAWKEKARAERVNKAKSEREKEADKRDAENAEKLKKEEERLAEIERMRVQQEKLDNYGYTKQEWLNLRQEERTDIIREAGWAARNHRDDMRAKAARDVQNAKLKEVNNAKNIKIKAIEQEKNAKAVTAKYLKDVRTKAELNEKSVRDKATNSIYDLNDKVAKDIKNVKAKAAKDIRDAENKTAKDIKDSEINAAKYIQDVKNARIKAELDEKNAILQAELNEKNAKIQAAKDLEASKIEEKRQILEWKRAAWDKEREVRKWNQIYHAASLEEQKEMMTIALRNCKPGHRPDLRSKDARYSSDKDCPRP